MISNKHVHEDTRMKEQTDSPELKTITNKKDIPNLAEAQLFCDGWVTLLRMPDGIMIVNEEGNLRGFPVNEDATALAKKQFDPKSMEPQVVAIVGNAIYLPKNLNQRKWR